MHDTSFDALAPFGWSPRVQALFTEFAVPGVEPGRVTRVERGACRVAVAGAEIVARAGDVAIGDWVALQSVDGEPSVVATLPRWSELVRGDPDTGARQTLAANVDLVLITAPSDRLSPARVERELVLAWDSGARPVVVVTKHDLAPDTLERDLRARLATIDVVATSVLSGVGIEELAALLAPDRSAVLLGPSGAGKSSLVNALLAEERLPVGDVRARDHRGRHTTASRELLVLPTGGVVIDTPGLRALRLAEAGDGISHTFTEIDELARSCRFSDCSHAAEPGCAVLAALAAGRVSVERLASWRKLQREVARLDPAHRRDARTVGRRRVMGARQRRRIEGRVDPRSDRDE